jgi:hypothetical protein
MDLDLRKVRYFVAVAVTLLPHTQMYGNFAAAS